MKKFYWKQLGKEPWYFLFVPEVSGLCSHILKSIALYFISATME